MLLSRLVENLAITVEPFGLCEVEAGCRLDLSDLDSTVIHFGLVGDGCVDVAGTSIGLSRHGLVVVPATTRHSVRANRPLEPIAPTPLASPEGVTRKQAFGDRGVGDLVSACGRIQARYGDGPRLFGHLREPLVFEFSDDHEMRLLFEQMLAESAGEAAGSKQMLAALMNRCLLLLFRQLCENDQCPLPWLSALEDEHLAAALDLILTDPGRQHSVESLAEAATMSRTTFAESFRQAFGSPPMTFLREVRLRKAASLLHDTTKPISAIAGEVGFSSRAHFAIAFRQEMGQTPTAYRNAGR